VGDCHGCIEELKRLYGMLSWISLDGIWSVGDLVDRGPDSGGVVDFCRTHGIHLVRGNHESTILSVMKTGGYTKNPDRNRTIKSIADVFAGPENWKYLSDSPYLWAIDDLNVVVVHAGLWPGFPLYLQANSHAVAIAQAINPEKLGDSVWYEHMARENAKAGFQKYIPWQDLYDGPENVVYGHSVYDRPRITQGFGGWTIGIDTGVPFGGSLTAVILPDKAFIQVPAAKVYCTENSRVPVSPPRYSGDPLASSDDPEYTEGKVGTDAKS